MPARTLFAALLMLSAAGESAEFPEFLSVYTLLGSPAHHDQRLVKTCGYLVLEYEGDALYASKTDFERALSKNAVEVQIIYDAKHKLSGGALDLAGLSERYVCVTGTFVLPRFGDSLFTGMLKDIITIDEHLVFRGKSEDSCKANDQ